MEQKNNWKKNCELEQYRIPLENALKVIKDHTACNYVADTREGFEDNPFDTKWVAEYFMPNAKKNGSWFIYFINDEKTPSKRNLKGMRRIRNSFWNSGLFLE